MYSVSAHKTGHFVPLIEYGLTIQYYFEMNMMDASKQTIKGSSLAAIGSNEAHQIMVNAYQFKWRLLK